MTTSRCFSYQGILPPGSCLRVSTDVIVPKKTQNMAVQCKWSCLELRIKSVFFFGKTVFLVFLARFDSSFPLLDVVPVLKKILCCPTCSPASRRPQRWSLGWPFFGGFLATKREKHGEIRGIWEWFYEINFYFFSILASTISSFCCPGTFVESTFVKKLKPWKNLYEGTCTRYSPLLLY